MVQSNWYAKRFTTRQAFLSHLEADGANELTRDRQGARAEIIGEVGILKRAKLMNNNPYNPCWECTAECDAVPGQNKTIKVIAWKEDILAVVTDANTDPWAFVHEVNDTDPTSSPDDLNRAFLIEMDTDFKFRMGKLQVSA